MIKLYKGGPQDQADSPERNYLIKNNLKKPPESRMTHLTGWENEAHVEDPEL